MRKQEVLAAIEKMIFPPGINDAVHTLADALPDIPAYAFYPSFRWVDTASQSREDVVLLLTASSLVQCRVSTDGFEVVDYRGRDVRQDARKVEIAVWPVNSIRRLVLGRVEGARARHSEAPFEHSTRVQFGDGGSGDAIVLPFGHDLLGADQNDKADVHERVKRFGDALLKLVAGGVRP